MREITNSTLIIPNVEFLARGPHLCSRPTVSAIAVRIELYYSELSKLFLPRGFLR